MSDTHALLERISSFRQRLESTPPLVAGDQAATTTALAHDPRLLTHTLRTLGSAPTDVQLPTHLTIRARQLLQEARGLIALQRELTNDPILIGLSRVTTDVDALDPLVMYHRETVAVTESALRMVQAFPESADAQLRLCEGVAGMLRAVRDRLTVARKTLNSRRRDFDRIDGLAQRLAELSAERPVELRWFAALAEQILEDSRQAQAIRFSHVEPHSIAAFPGAEDLPAPARYVAAHALTVAQIVARVLPHDFEWAGRPVIPVVAALLMDVGMLRIPLEVLAKSGPLSTAERREIETHPSIGADLIQRFIPQAGPIAAAVNAHHERPDGTGYPNAMKGEDIPSLARLLAACDVYAALASDRPHRPAHDPRTALTESLQAAEHGHLDRDFAEYLIHLSFHPVGTVVELTDGRVCVVAANHSGRANLRASARPVVAILTDPEGIALPRPEFVDLAAAQRGGIVRVLPRAERISLLAKHYPDLCG